MKTVRSQHFAPHSAGPDSLRNGKVLVMFVLCLPAVFAVMACYVDGSLMLVRSRVMQNAADAGATEAALSQVNGTSQPGVAAQGMVHDRNGYNWTNVVTNHPPVTGSYAGIDGYFEVTVCESYDGVFLNAGGIAGSRQVSGRAVAGIEASTAPAAIVVLDPDPATVSLAPLPIAIPDVHTLLGGMESLGVGQLAVDGAVLVNNEWGGLDENGDPVGESGFLQPACSCTPLLPLTKVGALNVRVVGGVDNPANYGHLDGSNTPILRANQRPVPDPLLDLPAPTLTSDPNNVAATEFGHVEVVSLPLLGSHTDLEPGVYESISVVGGKVTFEPGVYIIRSSNAVTGISLSLIGCEIHADEVMFYITDSESYSPTLGLPDQNDAVLPPPDAVTSGQIPSVLVADVLTNSELLPLGDPASPYHGMLIFQRRHDRRPILIVQEAILGSMHFAGNIYSKWGNLALVGNGTYESAFVVGSFRAVVTFQTNINPSVPMDPAYDVFLVE